VDLYIPKPASESPEEFGSPVPAYSTLLAASYVSVPIAFVAKLPEMNVQAGLVERGPTDPRCYALATSHLFGTCRIGSDPSRSVVSPDFRVHGRDALYVADASLFPTATGVNPQHAIMALARIAAQRLVEA